MKFPNNFTIIMVLGCDLSDNLLLVIPVRRTGADQQCPEEVQEEHKWQRLLAVGSKPKTGIEAPHETAAAVQAWEAAADSHLSLNILIFGYVYYFLVVSQLQFPILCKKSKLRIGCRMLILCKKIEIKNWPPNVDSFILVCRIFLLCYIWKAAEIISLFSSQFVYLCYISKQ